MRSECYYIYYERSDFVLRRNENVRRKIKARKFNQVKVIQ